MAPELLPENDDAEALTHDFGKSTLLNSIATSRSQPAGPSAEPFGLFDAWYQEAEDCDLIKYAAAACLSTVDLEGMPDGRIVLLELHDARGFVFFTDERSVKGQELARLPAAALTFYWGPLDRQIRIRGRVELASNEIADACFEQRPRASRVTAWASQQSQTLPDAADLERSYDAHAATFEGQESVPRPPHWRAYRLIPEAIEFWQAKARRLHDRRLYTRDSEGAWLMRALYP